MIMTKLRKLVSLTARSVSAFFVQKKSQKPQPEDRKNRRGLIKVVEYPQLFGLRRREIIHFLTEVVFR